MGSYDALIARCEEAKVLIIDLNAMKQFLEIEEFHSLKIAPN